MLSINAINAAGKIQREIGKEKATIRGVTEKEKSLESVSRLSLVALPIFRSLSAIERRSHPALMGYKLRGWK